MRIRPALGKSVIIFAIYSVNFQDPVLIFFSLMLILSNVYEICNQGATTQHASIRLPLC